MHLLMFRMSNVNYRSLEWNFSQIENLQKRVLRFLLNDYGSTYENLLEMFGCSNKNLRKQKVICIEILKTLNKLNPG